MKHLLKIGPWFFLMFTALNTLAQDPDIERIATYIGSGNTAKIALHLQNNINLVIDQNDNLYSKDQATQLLKQFFERNPALKFVVQHEGTARNNDIYRIGTLETKGGSYRVTYFLKRDKNQVFIKELRFEKALGF